MSNIGSTYVVANCSSVRLSPIVSLREHMVYNKHIKETKSEYPALSTLEILSHQSIVMEADSDLDEEPKKTCCFSWVRCCCISKLCRRLTKPNQPQKLAVSLPHERPMLRNTTTPRLLHSLPTVRRKRKKTVVSTTTPPFSGFTSPIVAGVVWKRKFACSGEQSESIDEQEMNEPFNNITETNNVVEEEQEKDSNSSHLNDEHEAESTAILLNERERTEEMQGHQSTTREEQTQKKKKNRKKAQNNEEIQTIVVAEEESRTTLPEQKVEQEREREHSGKQDKPAERTQEGKKKSASQNTESAPAELPLVPEEAPTIDTVAVPTITGEEPVTGVELQGAEHHRNEEQEQEEGMEIDEEKNLGEKDTEEEEKVTIVEVACTPPPWQRPQPSYNGSLQALAQEVLDFHRWAGGSEAESQRRMCLVEDVRNAVGVLWPAARVEVTGSLANGLYLPDSDVDLTLVGQWPPSPPPLLVLRDALLQQGVALPASLKVLEKTSPSG
ncbi:Non-canonical poly(A) RNA polymerase PAPD7 [Portunus trituberculatus]|uniref:Non-canonical poly(A) RNA polymerase PAPD7 n=1 Tax=Portunus trituberculatus TaxID=210409 RepID=A0A5B7HZQ5_PORTR|nr:Non-canonical poly(A) RNA polymerase PAPD7 [Portunus trituberculatus]